MIYTHEHADQTVGIFELRPFFWKNKKKIPIYGSKRTTKLLKEKYTFCFSPRSGYKPIMRANTFNKKFYIKKNDKLLRIRAIELQHGMIKANGFVFNKIAYLSDCNKIPKKSYNYLKNLDYLIIDCLRKNHIPLIFILPKRLKLQKNFVPKKQFLRIYMSILIIYL